MTLRDFAPTGNPITETSSTNMERTVIDRNGNTVATLKAEAYAGVASIDYSSILRAMFENGKGSMGTSLSVNKDYNLQVIATIAGTQYIFIRGVSQKTLVSNTNTFKFLTNMPHLRWYEGYPLDVSYLIDNLSAKSWYVRLDGIPYDTNAQLSDLASILKAHATSDLDRTPQGSIYIVDYIAVTNFILHIEYGTYDYAGYDSSLAHPYIWKGRRGALREYLCSDVRNPQEGDYVQNLTGTTLSLAVSSRHEVLHKYGLLELMNDGTVRDSIQIERYAVPAHPFYVRWVNPLGGWDYFMFACQQKQTKTLTANDTYEKYISYYGRYGQRSSYNKEATSEVEVSTGTIDRTSLESVVECIYSPLVQLYDKITSSWIEIQPATGKQDIMAEQPTGELLITFQLPTPQLNK